MPNSRHLFSDMKCSLVEESSGQTIPPNLKTLMSSLESPDDINDRIVVILYTLMVESGFVPVKPVSEDAPLDPPPGGLDLGISRLVSRNELPAGWKTIDPCLYRFKFQLENYSTPVCELIVAPLLDVLVVDLVVLYAQTTTRSASTFLLNTKVDPCKLIVVNKSPDELDFAKMKQLSADFKSEISLRARTFIWNDIGITNPSLAGIPSELTFKILKLLAVEDVSRVAQSCQRLMRLVDDNLLWQFLYKRDKLPVDETPDELFKLKYKKNRRLALSRIEPYHGLLLRSV
jgi:hypothetical protein